MFLLLLCGRKYVICLDADDADVQRFQFVCRGHRSVEEAKDAEVGGVDEVAGVAVPKERSSLFVLRATHSLEAPLLHLHKLHLLLTTLLTFQPQWRSSGMGVYQ